MKRKRAISAVSASQSPLPAGFGANEWLVDEMYQQYLEDKESVDPAWWEFFADYTPTEATENGDAAATDDAAGLAGRLRRVPSPGRVRRPGGGPLRERLRAGAAGGREGVRGA